MAGEHRLEFHDSLDLLKADVSRLANMTTELIARATAAFLERDLAELRAVIDSDDPIDQLAVDIEERCYQLLTLQSPLASDLRLIVTSLRLSIEIERCADLAVNVCKGARRIFDVDLDSRLRGLIDAMSREAARLVRQAAEAYADANEGLAAALDDFDDRLDDLEVELVQAILEGNKAGTLKIRESVQLALICRYYERIGDHAVNMGQRVIYMVSGWLPEHSAIARAELIERRRGALSDDAEGSGTGAA